MIKTGYIRTEIYKYIHEFEETEDRMITDEEFIDGLPKMYTILSSDPEKPLDGMSEADFLWIAGVGQATSHIPKGPRIQFINDIIRQRR